MATILASIPDGVEATSSNPAGWQQAMRLAIRSGRELLRLVKLTESLHCEAAATDFPVFVPREFVARMRTGDANDPLLRQVLSSAAEVSEEWLLGATTDPVGDEFAVRNPGLLQKYAGRALLITSGVCAERHNCSQRASVARGGGQPKVEVASTAATWEPCCSSARASSRSAICQWPGSTSTSTVSEAVTPSGWVSLNAVNTTVCSTEVAQLCVTLNWLLTTVPSPKSQRRALAPPPICGVKFTA